MTRTLVDRRSPHQMSYWLWMLVVGMASVIGAFVVINAFLPAVRGVTRGQLGQDFLAFYSAGRLVDSGRTGELYDLDALAALQQSIAVESGLPLASKVAPWWNPPAVAWLIVPLAKLSFSSALVWWTVFNLACLAGAAALLVNVIRSTSERKRDWLLVPALLLVAPPTLQALGHGQNTCMSLLLLTAAVFAWRARRPLLTGLVCAALCYKPQLAAVVMVAAIATLGWRVAIGALLGLVPALLLTVNFMPGALGEFVERVPANLHTIQFEHPYLWHRHVTFEGFLRFLFQGNGVGETQPWIHALALTCLCSTVIALAIVGLKLRALGRVDPDAGEFTLDRFITLVILATPLSMPFFFDYDLLLLAIPAVLVAREMMIAPDASPAARGLRVLGPITFVWLAINPPLAEVTGLNLTVPLIIALFALQARRCMRAPKVAISAFTLESASENKVTTRVAA